MRLTLPAGAASTSLQLENTGDEAVLVQAELMAWSQQDGKDVLTPSQDLVVSPPIFTVQPGKAQTIRVGLLRPSSAEREAAYRVFLQEVPRPPRPGEPAVSVALRLGLPVFVQPKGGGAPELAWRARVEGGALRLTLANSGKTHVQVLDCKVHAQDGTVVADEQVGAYVLAGQTRSWLLKVRQPLPGGKLKVTAQTSTGVVSADIAPD